MWQPAIVTLVEKKLVGKRLRMSLSSNRTGELWRSFMPERSKIKNRVSGDLISMSVYNETLQLTNANQEFDKWAAVEVSNFDNVTEGMEKFSLEGGLYAVFNYKGLSTDNKIFIYIFNTWLPFSAYILDDRPQFEVLGTRYKNNDPGSEEEIWIPIKPKN